MKKAIKYVLRNEQIRENFISFLRQLPIEPLREVTTKEVKSIRSLDQNAKMWAMLNDISKQVIWHGQKLTRHEWKDMITAALKNQKVVPGIDGGFVVIGARTSQMSIKEMIDVIDFAYAFGSDPEHTVKWSEPNPDLPEWVNE